MGEVMFRKSQHTQQVLAYSHETHQEFNERLEQRQSGATRLPPINGPWLSNKTMERLPRAHRQFDLNRDPYIRLQLLDRAKSESQRRKEQSDSQTGSGSGMVEQDKSAPVFRPSEDMSKSVDRAHFRSRWLTEQLEAVMAQAIQREVQKEQSRSTQRDLREPSL